MRKIGVSCAPEKSMGNRAILRVTLSLLVTTAQVIGVALATAPTRTPDTGAYFCCCIGECSCTGDCCNHAPTEVSSDSSTIRIGAPGPALEAPRSCGMWRATLQRGPDHGKVAVDHSRARSLPPPASPRLRRLQEDSFVSSDEGLRPSSPRAPPSPSVRT